MGDKFMKAATCGTGETSCQMGGQRSLTRICPSPYVIYCPPLHALLMMRFLLMLMHVSDKLRIPWEHSKTVPFSNVIPYLGFIWNLSACMVEVPLEKNTSIILRLRSGKRSHSTPWQRYIGSMAAASHHSGGACQTSIPHQPGNHARPLQ